MAVVLGCRRPGSLHRDRAQRVGSTLPVVAAAVASVVAEDATKCSLTVGTYSAMLRAAAASFPVGTDECSHSAAHSGCMGYTGRGYREAGHSAVVFAAQAVVAIGVVGSQHSPNKVVVHPRLGTVGWVGGSSVTSSVAELAAAAASEVADVVVVVALAAGRRSTLLLPSLLHCSLLLWCDSVSTLSRAVVLVLSSK